MMCFGLTIVAAEPSVDICEVFFAGEGSLILAALDCSLWRMKSLRSPIIVVGASKFLDFLKATGIRGLSSFAIEE